MADILLAAILGAHGLKGEVRAKVFTGTPDGVARYGVLHDRAGRRFAVRAVRPGKPGEAVLVLDSVNGRDAAEALKGAELFVERGVLPDPDEDEFYHADLLGMHAEDEQGRAIGTVVTLHNFGAGDVIEIARGTGDTVMLPFARDVVIEIDIANRRMVIALPNEVEDAQGFVE